jgi:hypothetical protein
MKKRKENHGRRNGYMPVCCKEEVEEGEYFGLYKELVEHSVRFL